MPFGNPTGLKETVRFVAVPLATCPEMGVIEIQETTGVCTLKLMGDAFDVFNCSVVLVAVLIVPMLIDAGDAVMPPVPLPIGVDVVLYVTVIAPVAPVPSVAARFTVAVCVPAVNRPACRPT